MNTTVTGMKSHTTVYGTFEQQIKLTFFEGVVYQRTSAVTLSNKNTFYILNRCVLDTET